MNNGISYNAFFAIYILYFILCWAISAFRRSNKSKKSIGIVLLMILLLSILMYFKPNDLKDSMEYERIWKLSEGIQLSNLRLGARYQNIEVLFVLYMKFLSALGLSFRGFCALTAFFIYALSLIGIKLIIANNDDDYSKDDSLIWLIYCAYFGLHYGAIAIRAGLGMALGLLAIGLHVKTRRYILPVFVVLLSSLMHSTCLVFLVVLLVYRFIPRLKKNTYEVLLVIMMAALLIGVGGYLFSTLSQFMRLILNQLGIFGFSYYFVSYDVNVGLKDWFFLLVFGGFIILSPFDKMEFDKLRFIVLLGLVVLTLLYPVRSINRLYDEFLIFSIPFIAASLGSVGIKNQKQLICSFLSFILLVPQIYMCY